MTEPEPEPELEQDLTFTIRSPLNEPTYNSWNIILEFKNNELDFGP